jgi:hypothetical protein
MGQSGSVLDPVDLNRAIERLHYPIPLFDEVASKCKGTKKFFKMDAQNGYWLMVLDKPSSELTTFNTMYCWYKWNQYPFELISAQDKYQQKMEEVFGELDIELIVDDIKGNSRNNVQHDAKLRAVLLAIRDKGVQFNREKYVFDTTSITYFGHKLTTSSIAPDPEKTKALENMPASQNQEELQTLLGMYNYLSRYIPNLSTLNKPL